MKAFGKIPSKVVKVTPGLSGCPRGSCRSPCVVRYGRLKFLQPCRQTVCPPVFLTFFRRLLRNFAGAVFGGFPPSGWLAAWFSGCAACACLVGVSQWRCGVLRVRDCRQPFSGGFLDFFFKKIAPRRQFELPFKAFGKFLADSGKGNSAVPSAPAIRYYSPWVLRYDRSQFLQPWLGMGFQQFPNNLEQMYS